MKNNRRLRSSHVSVQALKAVYSGEPIEPLQADPSDFPPSLKGELRRALRHKPAHELCLRIDAEGPSFLVETRDEQCAWLRENELIGLAAQARAADVAPDELLVLNINEKGSGFKLLKLNQVLDEPEPPPPTWAAC